MDLSGKVQAIVKKGMVKNGVVFLFVFGSTGAITTMEYAPVPLSFSWNVSCFFGLNFQTNGVKWTNYEIVAASLNHAEPL